MNSLHRWQQAANAACSLMLGTLDCCCAPHKSRPTSLTHPLTCSHMCTCMLHPPIRSAHKPKHLLACSLTRSYMHSVFACSTWPNSSLHAPRAQVSRPPLFKLTTHQNPQGHTTLEDKPSLKPHCSLRNTHLARSEGSMLAVNISTGPPGKGPALYGS